MNEKRKIKANDMIADIRGGMTASQLMGKYRLSTREMRMIFRKLLEAKAVSQSELDDRPTLYQCSTPASLRKVRRRRITFPLKIFEGGNPFKSGLVRDISEKGVCIEGLEAGVGDVKSFIIRSGNFLQGSSLVFEARCQWVTRKEEGKNKKILAGFEITNISMLDSKELQKYLP
jgi:hypothetical protein